MNGAGNGGDYRGNDWPLFLDEPREGKVFRRLVPRGAGSWLGGRSRDVVLLRRATTGGGARPAGLGLGNEARGGPVWLLSKEEKKKGGGRLCLCFLGFLFFLCIFSCFKINPPKKSV